MVVGVSDEATAWWPSPFGADDQLGMLNHIDDAKRAQALRLVRAGRLYDLGRVLDERIPVFPGRYFRQTLVTTAITRTAAASATNRVNWITEQIAGTQQLGTHLDALSHLQIGDRGYNGWTRRRARRHRGGEAARRRDGARRSSPAAGSSTSPPLGPRRRHRLDDVAGHRSGAGRRGALPHRLGRALGRRRHATSPASPGPGCELAEWLAERGVALTGCDTWSYGPVPAEDPDRPFEVPQSSTSTTASSSSRTSTPRRSPRDGVREFALILTHPKLRGATGAWTSPIALV